MPHQCERPFESIESTYDFFRLLSEAVAEAKREIEVEIERASASKSSRRVDALRVASYSVGKLELHVIQSCRILNDLRSLRRLLFAEREAAEVVAPSETAETKKPAMHRMPAPLPPQFAQVAKVARIRTKGGRAVAA
jgi:hypothetical protein